ncbi:MAG TPA: hypothetical protein VFC21_04220 [Bryobacteraceae bacterium]|nr:hypothetical protein [Bryobacteraceae bacterium]
MSSSNNVARKSRHKSSTFAQNFSFSANCQFRGSDTTAVTIPNDELVGIVFGTSKLGWFITLYTSANNWAVTRS